MLKGAPVLTVTDEDEGIHGGIVHFLIKDGRVRFSIDNAAAQPSGLELSSKLRLLAVPAPDAGA
ncbi:MAG: YfiR family protein [Caulobacteraceae bacterium]|nr:YfiR family protein [Caulobacteraceae bacterium]